MGWGGPGGRLGPGPPGWGPRAPGRQSWPVDGDTRGTRLGGLGRRPCCGSRRSGRAGASAVGGGRALPKGQPVRLVPGSRGRASPGSHWVSRARSLRPRLRRNQGRPRGSSALRRLEKGSEEPQEGPRASPLGSDRLRSVRDGPGRQDPHPQLSLRARPRGQQQRTGPGSGEDREGGEGAQGRSRPPLAFQGHGLAPHPRGSEWGSVSRGARVEKVLTARGEAGAQVGTWGWLKGPLGCRDREGS